MRGGAAEQPRAMKASLTKAGSLSRGAKIPFPVLSFRLYWGVACGLRKSSHPTNQSGRATTRNFDREVTFAPYSACPFGPCVPFHDGRRGSPEQRQESKEKEGRPGRRRELRARQDPLRSGALRHEEGPIRGRPPEPADSHQHLSGQRVSGQSQALH